MRWTEIDQTPCSLARTLSVIGDRWTMLIVRNAFLRVRRFDEFQHQLGVTRHVLADRLNKLVEAEVMEKVPYGEGQGRFEYRLTEKGIELYPIVLTMVDWGNRWMADADGPPVKHIHQACGHSFRPVLSCSHCDEPVHPREVTVKAGKPLQKLAKSMPDEALAKQIGYPALELKR